MSSAWVYPHRDLAESPFADGSPILRPTVPIRTAIAAAETANEVNPLDAQETPDDYLEADRRQWFSWEPAPEGSGFALVQLKELPTGC